MSERYEREIDDLLNRLENRMRREPLSRRISRRFRPFSRGFRSAFAAFLRRPPAEQFMIAAMILVILSFALNIFELSKLASYASILSIVLFVLGIAVAVAGRHSPGHRNRKNWRGREVEYDYRGPTIWTKLRDWLNRRR